MNGRMLRRCWTMLALAVLTLAGCSEAMQEGPAGSSDDDSSAEDGEVELVAPGKADNYYSNVSKEYEMTGTIPVEMTAEEFEDEATRNDEISQRTTAVGLYLTAYMTSKLEDLFDNMDYGGFKSMVRNHSVEREDVSESGENTYQVKFTIDVAGPKDLPSELAADGAERVEGGVQFPMQMPEGATADRDSASSSTPRNFDPADHEESELETVELTASPLPKINDSYPHYRSFAADGVYDITVVFGHDYNEDRWDIQTAEEVYETLVDEGFESPAASFEDLSASSGPFTKVVDGAGIEDQDEVAIEVRLLHADMFEGRRAEQREQTIEELRERDVFYYWGHAGPYFGFSLGPNSRADIDYDEIKELELSDKNQLVIASGCQTYSQYADVLLANPAKSEENLDVITTVNYSNLAAGDALLEPLVDASREGYHRPASFYELIEKVNEPFATSRMDTFYGVIGIDGNSRVHPYGETPSIGESCQSNRECGANPEANLCVQGKCAVRTLTKASCPGESEFFYLTRDGERVEGGICYER